MKKMTYKEWMQFDPIEKQRRRAWRMRWKRRAEESAAWVIVVGTLCAVGYGAYLLVKGI